MEELLDGVEILLDGCFWKEFWAISQKDPLKRLNLQALY